MKTGGRNFLKLLALLPLPASPPRACTEHADQEKRINQDLEKEVVSMAAARGWGGEARRGKGGRVEGGQEGRTGEGQAADQRVRKMGWTERKGGWEWASG